MAAELVTSTIKLADVKGLDRYDSLLCKDIHTKMDQKLSENGLSNEEKREFVSFISI
jgi:hypothetical protein